MKYINNVKWVETSYSHIYYSYELDRYALISRGDEIIASGANLEYIKYEKNAIMMDNLNPKLKAYHKEL